MLFLLIVLGCAVVGFYRYKDRIDLNKDGAVNFEDAMAFVGKVSGVDSLKEKLSVKSTGGGDVNLKEAMQTLKKIKDGESLLTGEGKPKAEKKKKTETTWIEIKAPEKKTGILVRNSLDRKRKIFEIEIALCTGGDWSDNLLKGSGEEKPVLKPNSEKLFEIDPGCYKMMVKFGVKDNVLGGIAQEIDIRVTKGEIKEVVFR